MSLTAEAVKARARELGADLVGIARGETLNRHPPDPRRPQTPERITLEDSRSVIVLARRILTGLSRLKGSDDRHKQYSTELILADLEEISLKLIYFLEDHGHPAITVPPMHFDPPSYDPGGDSRGPLSLPHAAVEAGLGTLGLNLMLLTPEFGPRVLLAGVLTSAPLEPDRPLDTPLCLGEACGRCLLACPGDAILQWALDKARCAPHASPYGFTYLTRHLEQVVKAETAEEQLALLKSKESFMVWQSILRGVGVYSGCTRCVDVCPVGKDYEEIRDVQEEIPERTPEKETRLAELARRAEAGDRGPHWAHSARWIQGPGPS
ncbi:MAG: epoxyqueuosine reductase [Candidatus Rokubacteria bacterium]|nr:epoxyqueuosine reductase [Candidatus Rokubacteria bacterium]